MKTITNKEPEILHLDNNYMYFLNEVKSRLKSAQIRAALAANREQIKFYWQLGSDLIEKQKAFKWESSFWSSSRMICGRIFLKYKGSLFVIFKE